MTDAELSIEIAEMIEPKPTDMRAESKVWIPQQRFNGHTFEHRWQPRDFVNDPACTVMLLSLPGFVSLYHVENEDGEDELYEADFCGEDVHSADCGDKIKMVRDARIGRAVAEAFLAANKEGAR